MVRVVLLRLEFNRLQRSHRGNDHHRRVEPMLEFYGMKIAVFAYHLPKTTLLNYLHSTHLNDLFQFEIRVIVFFFFDLKIDSISSEDLIGCGLQLETTRL